MSAVRLVVPLVLPLLLAAAPAPKPAAKPAPAAASVSGRVAGADGKPLSGAEVRILPKEESSPRPRWRSAGTAAPPVVVKTGEDGTFTARGLDGKSFRVRIQAKGLAPFQSSEVPAGATLRVTLKPGATRTGIVRDLQTKEPVAGATVVAIEPEAQAFGEEAYLRTTSGEDGRFTFTDLPGGDVAVEAWSPRHARALLRGFVSRTAAKEDEKNPVPTLFLRPGGSVAGKVVEADGSPVEGATVSVRPSSTGWLAMMDMNLPGSARTDAKGAFSFEGLPAGTRWEARAEKDGFSDGKSRAVDLERGDRIADLDVRLDAAATLAFRLIDERGEPLTEAQVSVEAASKAPAGPRGRRGGPRFGGGVDEDQIDVGKDGRFRVRGLDGGTFDVTVSPADGVDIEREGVKLTAAETADLGTLKVVEGSRIAGTITDRTGEPVAGAEIQAFWIDGDSPRGRNAKSKADGTYKLGGLGDAPLQQVRVRADGFAESRKQAVTPGDEGVDFVLEKTASVIGKVVNADGTVPPAFRVQAHPEAKAGEGMFGIRFRSFRDDKPFTDPAGNFRVDDVEPGKVTVEATAIGRAPARKAGVDVASEAIVDVGTLVLEDGRTLRGRVVDAKDDTPLAGSAVTVMEAQGGMRIRIPGMTESAGSAVSGTDGGFEIRGLEARNYTVAAQHPDFSPNETVVEVPADQDPGEIVVKLSRGGTLTGMVRDAGRQPVPNANILAVKGMFGGEMNSAATGVDGRYTIAKLSPGTYNVMRQPEDGRVVIGMGMKQAVIREGETTTLDFDEAAKHTIRGRVLRNGKPVTNAYLVVFQGDTFSAQGMKTTSVDSEGRYEVGVDEAGQYTVQVTGGGMTGGGTPTTIVVPDSPDAVIDIQLKGGAVTGRVTGSDRQPISGAFVVARASDGAAGGIGASGTAQTNAEGSFTLDGLSPGSYRVTASATGYASAEATIVVGDEGDAPPLDLRLEKGRSIRGRVVDARGTGVSGVFVVFAPTGTTQNSAPAVSTDVNGSFVATVGSEGAYDFTAIGAGLAPARATGIVAPEEDDGEPDVTLKMANGAHLRVRLVTKEGAPVEGASVVAVPDPPYLGSEMTRFLSQVAPTGRDGTTQVLGLAAGSYRVTAAVGKGQTATTTIAVPEGGEAEVTLSLP